MGLIQPWLADRVSDNLVAVLTKSESASAVILALLAMTLAGCASTANVQSDPNTEIVVSGQASVANLLAAGETAPITGAHEMLAATEMPFVRSQPKSVAPFPLILNRTVQHYVNQYAAQPQGLQQSFRRSRPYMSDMVRELENEGLPRDLIYLSFAVSGFSPKDDGP